MKPPLLIALAVFGAVLGLHFGYHAWQEARVAAQWVQIAAAPSPSAWTNYLERGDYWLGYSYALAAGFTAFGLARMVRRRRQAAASVAGGVTMLGVLYGAGCFLVGCCGSPMLAVYLSVFGASVLGFIKPIVAAVTTLSVVGSAILLEGRTRRASCECPPAAGVASGDRPLAAMTGVPWTSRDDAVE